MKTPEKRGQKSDFFAPRRRSTKNFRQKNAGKNIVPAKNGRGEMNFRKTGVKKRKSA
jgi:hypothetical protein